MPKRDDFLEMDDDLLLKQCRVETYRSSGPGGQHRNKVSSAVRLTHIPTGLVAHGDESRSQHDNKAAAIKRLRIKIACGIRCPLPADNSIPPVVSDCIFTPKGQITFHAQKCESHTTLKRSGAKLGGVEACTPKHTTLEGGTPNRRLKVGRKDFRFWKVAAFALDVFENFQGRLAPSAKYLGVTSSSLATFFKSDRHLLGQAQAICKNFGGKPIL